MREEKDSPSRLWNGGQDETREEIKKGNKFVFPSLLHCQTCNFIVVVMNSHFVWNIYTFTIDYPQAQNVWYKESFFFFHIKEKQKNSMDNESSLTNNKWPTTISWLILQLKSSNEIFLIFKKKKKKKGLVTSKSVGRRRANKIKREKKKKTSESVSLSLSISI